MGSRQPLLEALFEKVRALPDRLQEQVAEAIADIAEEPYVLDEDELAVILPEIEGAKRGEFASRDDVENILHKTWTKTKSP
jgi:hypothetical protein